MRIFNPSLNLQDGLLLVHDIETQQVTACLDLGLLDPTPGILSDEGESSRAAVAAVCFSPREPSHVMFAAVGHAACMVDLREHRSSSGASSSSVPVTQTYRFCKDDIGHLALHAKGGFLALADDTGAVQVVDLTAGKLFKSIRQAHSNICSSVAFRRHRPWELLSGGLDTTVARYGGAGSAALFDDPAVLTSLHGLWQMGLLDCQAAEPVEVWAGFQRNRGGARATHVQPAVCAPRGDRRRGHR